ncbi:MAG: 2-oxoacid:acceptor oxidoreductase family protein [Bacillota bacterium]|nr:2-oxoacid:acceptor oxidoreductase family protein [Bacillota bacterium]
MPQLTEIRWHSRGGQGAKTAAILLAEAASAAGMYVQGFPEYGPERMGAPMLAFNRISGEPISVHSHVEEPGVVMVLDPSLIGKVDVLEGLLEGGIVIINTGMAPEEMRAKMQGSNSYRVCTVDASKIAVDTIGRDIPNTPMMGALMKVAGIMDYAEFVKIIREQLEHKFRSRPEIVQGNVKAIERAYQEVRG